MLLRSAKDDVLGSLWSYFYRVMHTTKRHSSHSTLGNRTILINNFPNKGKLSDKPLVHIDLLVIIVRIPEYGQKDIPVLRHWRAENLDSFFMSSK